jgi:hypothetical protein
MLGEEQASRQPAGLVFDVLVPDPAARVVHRGRRWVCQEAVAELVTHVAVLANQRVAIVMDDRPARAVEHRDSREGFRLNCCQVIDARRGVTKTRQVEHRNGEVVSKVAGIEAVKRAKAKLSCRVSSAICLAHVRSKVCGDLGQWLRLRSSAS